MNLPELACAAAAAGQLSRARQKLGQWADKYQGKFDQGWDKLREETLARQKKLGIVPRNTELTTRPDLFPAWNSLNDAQKKLYAREMEVFAGYSENADWNIGRLLDAIQELGDLDNTLVIYIFGDNGSSMEGTLTGSFNELTFLNGLVLDAEQQTKLIEQYGGMKDWGGIHTAPHFRRRLGPRHEYALPVGALVGFLTY